MRKLFNATLEIMASHVHINMKYQNVYEEFVTICDNLFSTRRIHKALKRNQDTMVVGKEKENTLEVNIAYLSKHLDVMEVSHHNE